ncbi:DUF456 domain-containing protein [Streptomyces sp. NBC_01190]|uniref:DUF456 domain-containing protein n=1 Tax=Streptomyces sp. NBC_01190 TaxID=2903767 RepID=UPI003865FA40|nr:DUF456 domain-containing protein [Streptomyces sp. NBC_01190]
MGTPELSLIGAVMVLGLVGVAAPGVPGALLVWASVLWWAALVHTTLAWGVLAGATVVLVAAESVVWLLPSRRITESGVTWRTVLNASGVAIAAFWVLPVVGALLGFVGSIYLTERHRLGGGHGGARAATRRVMRTVGNSVLVELLACLLITGTWLGAVLAS